MNAVLTMHTATLFFGLSGLFGRISVSSAQTLVAGRALFAVLVLGLVLCFRENGISTNPRAVCRFFASGVLLTAHFVTFFQGIKLGGVALGTLGFACFPAFTALFEVLFFHERMSSREWQALCGVALGLWCLVPEGSFSLTDNISERLAGLLFGVLSAVIYAGVAVLNRFFASNVSGIRVNFWQNCTILLLLLPCTTSELLQAPLGDWGCFAFLGIFCTALAYSMYVSSLRVLPARQAAIIISLEPVYTIVLAWLLLGETPGLQTVLGGFLILAAVIRLNLR